MMRRLLIATVCSTVLALGGTAGASSPEPASTGRAAAGAAVAVKKVVRSYGAGPVSLVKDQQLELRFHGRRGDRVRLSAIDESRNVFYGDTSDGRASLHGRGAEVKADATGFFRLPRTGWFRLDYRAEVYNASRQRVQLIKQVRLTHEARGTTPLPQRRGFEYAVSVRAPRAGLQVVSFGTRLRGVVSKGGGYRSGPNGHALVVAPGLPVLAVGPTYDLSKPLAPRQRVLVLVNPSYSGKVVTTTPADAGRVALDGPALSLPTRSTGAVVAELSAADLGTSAQRLLNVRLVGDDTRDDWGVLVLRPDGGVVPPSAPAWGPRGSYPVPLFQLPATAGTYRVLAFASQPGAAGGSLELDSVAQGSTIALDGPAVTVPARPDGRFTLLDITQPDAFTTAYLYVTDVTVADPWAVYAGRLTVPNCPPWGSLGCGEGNGVIALSGLAGNSPVQYGGHVLTMPGADQVTGSFTVRLTTARPS